MLYNVPTLIEWAKIWYERTGRESKVVIADFTEPEAMRFPFKGDFQFTRAENS